MSFLPGCSQGFLPWLYLGFRSVILMCLGVDSLQEVDHISVFSAS